MFMIAQVVKFSKQIKNNIPWLKSVSMQPGNQIQTEYITLGYSQKKILLKCLKK